MRDTLIKGLNELNISYSDVQLDKIDTFYRMIIDKNKVMNLTRITDMEEFYIKHILDSLLICKVMDISNRKIIDVGTGAGFPGIPAKIFFKNIDITLMDSLKKRLTFLDEVISKLGLSETHTLHGRAEEIGKNNKYRESFDIVVSRAVADMSVLSELCLPLVSVNGFFIAYKSNDSSQEIESAERSVMLMGGSKPEAVNSSLPCSNITRKIVIVKKITNTPDHYPRKAGGPSKKPIL